MSEPKPTEKVAAGIALIGLLSRLLSAIEMILPAALVAWNASLKAKTVAAHADAVVAKAKLKGELDAAKIADETRGTTIRELLNRGIGKSRARTKPPTK